MNGRRIYFTVDIFGAFHHIWCPSVKEKQKSSPSRAAELHDKVHFIWNKERIPPEYQETRISATTLCHSRDWCHSLYLRFSVEAYQCKDTAAGKSSWLWVSTAAMGAPSSLIYTKHRWEEASRHAVVSPIFKVKALPTVMNQMYYVLLINALKKKKKKHATLWGEGVGFFFFIAAAHQRLKRELNKNAWSALIRIVGSA